MRLFSYIVARDYGFAPNPFYGYCTLATCMPLIRARASVSDWIIGTGAKTKYNLSGHLIYAMKVNEILDFNAYWNDSRFQDKRPIVNGSLKQLYGDNIYHKENGAWVQENSHHSLSTGKTNQDNVSHDTSENRLLIAQQFVYFGNRAPVIPGKFRPFKQEGKDICCHGRGYHTGSSQFASEFESWLNAQGLWGIQGIPLEFNRHNRIL